jgi:hypothetical protein
LLSRRKGSSLINCLGFLVSLVPRKIVGQRIPDPFDDEMMQRFS